MGSASQSAVHPPGYLEADTSGNVYAATSIMLTFATILLGLRIYARTLTQATRGWDDFFLLPSYVLFLGLCILMYGQSDSRPRVNAH